MRPEHSGKPDDDHHGRNGCCLCDAGGSSMPYPEVDHRAALWPGDRVRVPRTGIVGLFAPSPRPKAGDCLRYAAMVSVLAYTGLRPGELLALTRRDVRERTITVRAKVVDGKRLPGVKTRRSRPRSPMIIPSLRADLDAWLARVPEEADALVFGTADGRPWSKDLWDNWRNRAFKPALADTGVPMSTRPYDLRHTCVSLRVMQGDNVIEIADDLGHNVSMTLDTYSHVIGEYRGLPASERPSMEELVQRARAKP